MRDLCQLGPGPDLKKEPRNDKGEKEDWEEMGRGRLAMRKIIKRDVLMLGTKFLALLLLI